MARAPKKPKKAAPDWPEKFRELRELWGDGKTPMRQEDAAEKIGVTRRSWVSWETGERVPSKPICLLIDTLLRVAKEK